MFHSSHYSDRSIFPTGGRGEKLKITDRPSKIDGPKVRHRPGISTPVPPHTAEMKEKLFDDESPSSYKKKYFIISTFPVTDGQIFNNCHVIKL